MLKLIVFDWDDVITLGAKEGYFKCYHETLIELGVNLEPEEEKRRILAKWSKPHREELKELLKENPNLLDKACRIYEKKLFGDTFVNSLSLVPDANELLLTLKKKYTLCVATGQHPKILKERVMPKFGIPNVFTQIISTYDVDDPEKHKPHPHILYSIMEKQEVSSTETIFVGDARSDVLMARAAHVEPIVVLTGHLNRSEAEKLRVKYIISDVTGLKDLIGVF
jgi:phosphoglycolate phosphatase-like HAD superfamily hydrolase